MIIELLSAHPMGEELLAALRYNQFEILPTNKLWFPKQELVLHGLRAHHYAEDGLGWQWADNIFPTEGLNYLLDVALHDATKVATWYVGAYAGNVVPAANWTAANFASTATELNAQIAETTRPEFVETAASSGSSNNTASPVTITAATGQSNVTIWGAGVLSSSTKAGTSGILLSAEKFTAARTMVSAGDTLDIKITLNLTST